MFIPIYRAYFATHLLGNGADLRIIQVAWARRYFNNPVYTHVDQQRLKAVHHSFIPGRNADA
jgi:integrase/recombinase XerD